MYRLICQKPAQFLSAKMALVSTFLQMFIVLGIYNFDMHFKIRFHYVILDEKELFTKHRARLLRKLQIYNPQVIEIKRSACENTSCEKDKMYFRILFL